MGGRQEEARGPSALGIPRLQASERPSSAPPRWGTANSAQAAGLRNGTCANEGWTIRPTPLRSPLIRPMFTLSQYIIIGLAGSIYVAGAAFLLTGHSFVRDRSLLPVDASEGRVGLGAVEASPFYVPVPENNALGHEGPRGPVSPVGEGPTGTSPSAPSPDRQAVGPESEEVELVLLTNPICMN